MKVVVELFEKRGVSPAVGVVLMLAIVVVLAAGVGALTLGVGQDSLTDPTSQVAVDVDETETHVELTPQATRAQADQLTIKINGKDRVAWKEYDAGQSKELYCLEQGDEVAVVEKRDGSEQLVTEHTVESPTDCQFSVDNGSETSEVQPINFDTASEAANNFYSYGGDDGTGHPHTHMDADFVEPDTTYMFFYVFGNEVSLVVVHDTPATHTAIGGTDHSGIDVVDGATFVSSDTGGGSVDMRFEGLPESGSWVVQDDGGESDDDGNGAPCTDPVVSGGSLSEDPYELGCWSWTEVNTDGGVRRGGFTDTEELEITVHSEFNEQSSRTDLEAGTITDYEFVTRNEDGDIETIELTRGQPVTIEGDNE
jgi:flagellin-like protein